MHLCPLAEARMGIEAARSRQPVQVQQNQSRFPLTDRVGLKATGFKGDRRD